MFNRVQKINKSHGGESHGTITSPQPKSIQGRERLQFFVDQIAAAHNAIEELECHVSRLGAIVVEAEVASRALQDAISLDGGVELSRYSSGECNPDDAISKLVKHSQASGEAASAAKAGLPHTQLLLDAARQQLASLINEKAAEVGRVVASLADIEVRSYEKSFEATCRLHDSLVGFARVAQNNVGDIHLMEEPPKISRFVVVGDNTADPFYHHRLDERVADESAKRWSEIRSRLELNANCDLSDLD